MESNEVENTCGHIELPDLSATCSHQIKAAFSNLKYNPETGQVYDLEGNEIGKGTYKNGAIYITLNEHGK